MFAYVSGLQLNLPKTIIVPLGDDSPLDVKAWLHDRSDAWQEISCEGWSVYLGIATGPEKGLHSWSKALKSFGERSELWPWKSMGLQFSARAYNTFVFSVLSFVCQLEDPPPLALDMEKLALTRAAPGPHNWCAAADLWNLDSAFNFGFYFRNLACFAKAAQMRVVIWEAIATGGIHLSDKIACLDEALLQTEFLGRRYRFASWYEASHVRVLQRAVRSLSDMQLSTTQVLSFVSQDAPMPWTKVVHEVTKSSTQRFLYTRLTRPSSVWAEECMG